MFVGYGEKMAEVQVFRREFHIYIHLDYARVEFLSYIYITFRIIGNLKYYFTHCCLHKKVQVSKITLINLKFNANRFLIFNFLHG